MITTSELSPTPGMCLESKELLIQFSREGDRSANLHFWPRRKGKINTKLLWNLTLGLFCTEHGIFAPEEHQDAVSSRRLLAPPGRLGLLCKGLRCRAYPQCPSVPWDKAETASWVGTKDTLAWEGWGLDHYCHCTDFIHPQTQAAGAVCRTRIKFLAYNCPLHSMFSKHSKSQHCQVLILIQIFLC